MGLVSGLSLANHFDLESFLGALRQDALGPGYFSDQISPSALTPLVRFGLLNCPAV